MSMNGKLHDTLINGNHSSEDVAMDMSIVSNGDKDKDVTSCTRQTEILRCFAQYLLDQSYKGTYEKLVNESGVVLENHNVAKLRESVLNGDWIEAEDALTNLKYEVNSDENLKQMQFLILEQRILEAMEEKNFIHGVELLRERLTPMNLNRERVHHLATCLMYKEIAELHNMASWKGKNGGTRELLVDKLQGFIPAQVMLPPKRLENLLSMAVKYQIIKCPFHNGTADIFNQSLLQNHDCEKRNFPTTIVQSVKLNKSELWISKFSPDGQKLVVGGKENNVDVFTVNQQTFKISRQTELQCTGHINFIVWSWDSKRIAVCSSEDHGGVFVFDLSTEKCICTVKVHEEEPYNCVAFLKDNNKLAVGSLKGIIHIVEISEQARVLTSVEGYRAHGMSLRRLSGGGGNDCLLVADTHKRIRQYKFGYDLGAGLPGASESGGIAMLAPGSASTSSESISVTHGSSTTPVVGSTAAASATVSSSNPLVMQHALSSPGLANQMLQWVSSPTSGTAAAGGGGGSQPTWLHSTVPVIPGMDFAAATAASSAPPQPPAAASNSMQMPYTLIHDETLFEVDSSIQSIVASKNSDRLLISLNKVGLCMWHLPSKQILQRFVGAEQKKFTLHPSFGGYNEEYIACGSETGYVCMWQQNSGMPAHQVLLQHDSPVNCVHWNPENWNMLAAVNDAGTLHIIGPARFDVKD